MISIVDYGMGNLGSMLNMLKRIGVEARIEADPIKLSDSSKLILPGVGAFDAAMSRISGVPGLRSLLDNKVLVERVPVLGVCLGMQLLTDGSDEGELPGFGWIPASTRRIPKSPQLKVPHMGWNVARPTVSSRLTAGIDTESRYYFVHSYAVHVKDPEHSLMRTYYGLGFDSAIGRDNIYGVQFHPEKSHRFGMQLLKNFADL